ncbi:TPA: phosphoribosylamine--glycine ligase [Candidatus Woesearchaeota archaeon]|nr:phosphoribosylamine--glycine ligase [uncultured archaeon]HIH05331.1 phosphoribosylamine--glycine ligase [Candidatus Woesearchaeota archaeon]HII64737.1 phosphoribosylamine--glycine ligase [Candidatus Woesearchaeota archaeon]HIJ18984.1 phosphoribosylamine--glycine ligase [Candidatus Woesearchaeota archaeon]
MTKILLVGNGAREHAIAETLEKSRHRPRIYAYMKANNPGILTYAEGVELGSYSATHQIAAFAKKVGVEFAIIGPEEPLKHGVADALAKEGIPCIGPKRILAQLETSKSFTRSLLDTYKIPGNPLFASFTRESIANADAFVRDIRQFVVKPDGLTGGKGVWVQGDHFRTKEEGIAYARECLQDHPRVIIEEKLEGEEFSLQCLTDGETVVAMPAVQDHKRAFEDDKGPNTGGMGSYSCPDHLLPFLTRKDVEEGLEITKKVCRALYEEAGDPYIGVMYGGFMKTKKGVRLIEYNARFGDPETMNVLPILKTDFVDICRAMIDSKLETVGIEFAKKATVCKYIVPEGYPSNPAKGGKIEVDESADAYFYYAAVEGKEDGIHMSPSRAVGVVGIADTLEEAERIAEDGCSRVKGKVYHRRDIGTRQLIQKRIDHMDSIMKP